MKSKTIHLLTLVLSIALFACQSKSTKKEITKAEIKEETEQFFTIPFADIVKNKRIVKLSEFANDVKLIQFENIPEAMFGNVENIEFTKDYIFIKFWMHPVLQFSREGKFIRDIGKKGKGPGEYNICMKMSIDEKNKRVYVHTGELSMIVFNFEGEHIKTFSYPALGLERYLNLWSRDSMLVSYMEPFLGNQPFVFIEHNEKGDTLQTISNYIYWDNNDEFGSLSPFEEQNFTYRFKNKLHMKGCYNDTVYTYNENNKFVPKFLINLGKHKLPEDLIYERKWKRSIPENLCWTSVYETTDYIFIPYGYHYDINKAESQKEEKGCILYNKKTKEGIAVEETKQGGFIDDFTGSPDFRPIATNDSTAIMLVSAIDMKQYLDSDIFKNQGVKFPEEKEKLIRLNKTLKEDDNHFLVIVKLKE